MTRRLQVLLDEPRYLRVAALARRRKVSVATVVREAIDRGLPAPDREREAAGRRLLAAPEMDVPADVQDLLTELSDLRSRRS